MRALRRHHRDRLKKARKHYWGWGTSITDHEDMPDYLIGPVVTTPQRCSSYCCGNPRKHFHQITRQEKIAAVNEQEQRI